MGTLTAMNFPICTVSSSSSLNMSNSMSSTSFDVPLEKIINDVKMKFYSASVLWEEYGIFIMRMPSSEFCSELIKHLFMYHDLKNIIQLRHLNGFHY